MTTIFKYPLQLSETVVGMPRGARVLSCAEQYGMLCVWAAVDHGEPNVPRLFFAFPTGAPMAESGIHRKPQAAIGEFVGTVLMNSGSFVVHVFDGGEV